MDREVFIQAAKRQPDISPAELSQACKDNSILFRFLGKLFREQLEFENSLVHMDLVTEEGRLIALRQQGIVQGRAMLIEGMTDLFLEGDESGSDQPEPEFELVTRKSANAAE
jgi:hypothetical protein